MEGKHTPGPWRVVRHDDEGGTKWLKRYSVEGERSTVAGFTEYDVKWARGEAKFDRLTDANARLIAAAPDMLAVLHRLVDDPDLEDTEAVRIITAAIERAES
jgi:hypothetical protein